MELIYIFIAAFVGILIGLWIADIYHDFNDKWISVEDDLPELSETVVFMVNSSIYLGYRITYDEVCLHGIAGKYYKIKGDKITHWKRLPKLPKL